MEEFLKISEFDIPKNISRDAGNHGFPYRLLSKNLHNGESCKRDWLCWSNTKQALFCVPCFLKIKSNMDSSILGSAGWDINKGWRKLKDRIPSHENTTVHKNNYINWKLSCKAAIQNSSLGSILLNKLTEETNKWEKKILERILDVILFLSERGLPFFGSNKHIASEHNGNFLGIIELLSKYDPILYDHVQRIRDSQHNKNRLQVHYLSRRIQNEFIELCGSFVQNKILEQIRTSKYFCIVADATPDCSHKEQTSLIIRYVKIIDGSNFSIEERFITFDSFVLKTGKEIASRILEILDNFNLNFDFCVGQAYDNGANMAGAYNGVQAILLERNPNCIFSSCGNHTLNLVGVDSVETCKEGISYFGRIQQMYNFFSSSPRRWEILKKHVPASLHSISKTR